MTKLHRRLALLLTLGPAFSAAAWGQGGVLPPAPPAYEAPPPTYGVRPEAVYAAGDGVGYKDGYFRLGLFAPALQSPGEWVSFGDYRLILDNRSGIAGNIGFGYRQYAPEMDRTLGGYGYYDFRNTDLGHFQQITLGLETLGEFWDARLNAHISTSKDRFTGAAGDGTPYFAGNRIFIDGIAPIEQAMSGVDFKISANRTPGGFDVRPFAGLYYFTGTGSQDVTGVRAGAAVRPAEWATVTFEVQQDGLFETNFVCTAAFAFPSRKRREAPRYFPGASARLADPVDRLDLIVLDQTQRAVASVALLDGRPASDTIGSELPVVHVSNNPADVTNPGAPLGSFENPYRNFAQLRDGTAGNELVYVRGGAAGIGGAYTFVAATDVGDANTFYTLRGDQWIFGAGIDQVLPVANPGFGGSTIIAAAQGANPTLSLNAGQTGLTMRNDTLISGLSITGGATGIAANAGGRRDPIIINNTIAGVSGDAISLLTATGTATVSDNVINGFGAGAAGIRTDVTGTGTLTVVSERNVIANGGEGYRFNISSSDANAANITLRDNLIGTAGTGMSNDGIRFEMGSTGTTRFLMENNTVFGGNADGEAALFINRTSGGTNTPLIVGTVSNNDLTGGGANAEGLRVEWGSEARSHLTIVGNTITGGPSGSGDAIRLLRSGGADGTISSTYDIRDNVLTANGTGTGLRVEKTGSGSLQIRLTGNDFNTAGALLSRTGTGPFNFHLGPPPVAGTALLGNESFLTNANVDMGAVSLSGATSAGILFQPDASFPPAP